MLIRIVSAFILLINLTACVQYKQDSISAQGIVNKAIERSGTSLLSNTEVNFDFRDKSYRSIGHCGVMTLERISNDSTGNIVDVLDSRGGFKRIKNDILQNVPDSMVKKYSSSINSVHYFVQLPWRINDPAVNKEYIGKELVKNKSYHLIKVTFNEDGGGEDHEDVYLYWFHTDSFTVDYLAYRFQTNGGGMRFREAFNPRYIEGIRFVDYNNYKPLSNIKLLEIAQKFDSRELKKLSVIKTENVKVELNTSECD